jgi:hypothetical protein
MNIFIYKFIGVINMEKKRVSSDSKINKIKREIGKSYEKLSKNNVFSAKRLYIKIMKIYINLRDSRQKMVYSDILALYKKRKDIEAKLLSELKNKGEEKKRQNLEKMQKKEEEKMKKMFIKKKNEKSNIMKTFLHPSYLIAIAVIILNISLLFLFRKQISEIGVQEDVMNSVPSLIFLFIGSALLLFILIVFFAKDVKKKILVDWYDYLLKRFLPIIIFWFGIFILVAIVLLFWIFAPISTSIEPANTNYIAMGLLGFFLIIIILLISRWLGRDVKKYSKHRDNEISLPFVNPFVLVHNERKPDKVNKKKIKKIENKIDETITNENIKKDLDSALKTIIEVRELLLKKEAGEAKILCDKIVEKSKNLDKEAKELIFSIVEDLRKEIYGTNKTDTTNSNIS